MLGTGLLGAHIIDTILIGGEVVVLEAVETSLRTGSLVLRDQDLPFQRGVEGEVENNIEVGGRLHQFRNVWSRDPWAKSLVRQGLSWRWLVRPKTHCLTPQRTSSKLWEYVQEMLEKKVVRPFVGKGVQNHLFSVPKKDSTKDRVILDLSRLNRCIPCPKFKMTSTPQVH